MSLSHSIAFRIVKKGMRSFDPNHLPDFEAQRKQERIPKLPKGVTREGARFGRIPGEWLRDAGNRPDKAILYIHGGGFIGGSSASRRDFTGYLAKTSGYDVASVDYRLAPEHPFPAAPKDCFAAYQVLVQLFGAENLALAGESAGGNLVLSVLLQAKDAGIPLLACATVISPTVQYDRILPSYEENRETECMVGDLSLEVQTLYVQTDELPVLQNAYGAPLYGELDGFPPVQIIVSSSEALLSDSVELYRKLRRSGVKSDLIQYTGMMHAFAVIPTFPESRKAIREMETFWHKNLDRGTI